MVGRELLLVEEEVQAEASTGAHTPQDGRSGVSRIARAAAKLAGKE